MGGFGLDDEAGLEARRVARSAERDGRELAAVSDLGDGGEHERLDHLVSGER